MTRTIIYHKVKPEVDCPDGICAAWVSWLAVKDSNVEIEIIGDSYLNNEQYQEKSYALPFDPTDKNVVLVDFSYPSNILEVILAKANSLTILDHHKSRMNDIESFRDRLIGGYSPDDCGATFAWKFFFPGKSEPWFLKHVRRRDIGADGYYEGNCPESEAIGAAMSARRKGLKGKDAFQVFDRLLEESEADLIAEGMPEIQKRDGLVQEALAQYNGALLKVGDYLVPYYQLSNQEAHKYYSTIGSEAAKIHKGEFPFVAIATNNPLEISLRAAEGSPVDLSAIAKSLGGGGQERAGGFKMLPSLPQSLSK